MKREKSKQEQSCLDFLVLMTNPFPQVYPLSAIIVRMKYVRQVNGLIRAAKDFTLHDGRAIAQGTLGGRIASSRNLAQSGNCWVFPGAEVQDDAYVSGNAVVSGTFDAGKVEAKFGDLLTALQSTSGTQAERNRRAEILQGINSRLSDVLNPEGGSANTTLADVLADPKKLRELMADSNLMGTVFRAFRDDAVTVSGIDKSEDIAEQFIDLPAVVKDSGKVYGNALVQGAAVSGEARVLGNAVVRNGAEIGDEAHVIGTALVTDKAQVSGNARVQGGAIITGPRAIVKDNAVVTGTALVYGVVQGEGRVSECVLVDEYSMLKDKARASGCGQIIRTTLEGNAVVTGDYVLEDEFIEDPSLATNCPEKVSQINDEECCTPRELYLAIASITAGELTSVRLGIKELVKAELEGKEEYRMVYCPETDEERAVREETGAARVYALEPARVGFIAERYYDAEEMDIFDDAPQILLAKVRNALLAGHLVQAEFTIPSAQLARAGLANTAAAIAQSLQQAGRAFMHVSNVQAPSVWRVSETTEGMVNTSGVSNLTVYVLTQFAEAHGLDPVNEP